MKIAFVSQPFDDVVPPVESGSIPIWTYQVALRLARSHEVLIYARKGNGRQKEQYQDGIRYRRISFVYDKWLLRFLRVLAKFSRRRRPLFASAFYGLGYALQVACHLRTQRYDVAHIHNYSQFARVIRILNPNLKIVLHTHAEWLTQLNRVMIARRLRHVDLIAGCSDYITNKVRKAFPEFASRCVTVYNGVDSERFVGNGKKASPKGDRTQRLLFVGRHSPEKGVNVLLDAFREVVSRHPQIHLEIIGPEVLVPKEFIVSLSDDPVVSSLSMFYDKVAQPGNGYSAYLQSQRSSGLADKVSFVGSIPHSQVIKHYQEADVVINPSFSESFGMSLIEAMAAEVPVIASRVGGMVEVVAEGETGLLVEPGDAHGLAMAIGQLLSNETLRRRMGKAGRQRVLALFTWEKISHSLLTHYQRVCAEP